MKMAYSNVRYTRKLDIGMRDASREIGHVNLYIPAATSMTADTDGDGIPDFLDTELNVGQGDTWLAALRDVAEGTLTSITATEALRQNEAVDGEGAREDKILWRYQDIVTGEKFEFHTPGRPGSIAKPLETDYYDISLPPFAMFVIQTEAIFKSPNGNTINILSAELV
jgi:hypothetical protein